MLEPIPEASPTLKMKMTGRMRNSGFLNFPQRTINSLGRRKSNSLGETNIGSYNTALTGAKTNRYAERKKAKATLAKLNIVDPNKAPASVLSHSLLTQDTQQVDLIGKSSSNSQIKFDSLNSNNKIYTRRGPTQKLDLELTLLQVLEGQRGRGSQVRSKE